MKSLEKQLENENKEYEIDRAKTATESIMAVLYGISANMNISTSRELHLTDFYVIYDLYKERVKQEKQQQRNISKR